MVESKTRYSQKNKKKKKEKSEKLIFPINSQKEFLKASCWYLLLLLTQKPSTKLVENQVGFRGKIVFQWNFTKNELVLFCPEELRIFFSLFLENVQTISEWEELWAASSDSLQMVLFKKFQIFIRIFIFIFFPNKTILNCHNISESHRTIKVGEHLQVPQAQGQPTPCLYPLIMSPVATSPSDEGRGKLTSSGQCPAKHLFIVQLLKHKLLQWGHSRSLNYIVSMFCWHLWKCLHQILRASVKFFSLSRCRAISTLFFFIIV